MDQLTRSNWFIYDKRFSRKKMILPVFIIILLAFTSFFFLYTSIDFMLIKQDHVKSIVSLFIFLFTVACSKYFYNDLISTIEDVNYYIFFMPIFTLKEQFIVNKIEQMLKFQNIKYKKIKVEPLVNYPFIVFHLFEINIFIKLKNSDFVEIHKHSIRVGPLLTENKNMIYNILDNLEKLKFKAYRD